MEPNIPQFCDRKVEIVPISRLKPCANNARTHSRKQIRLIADSIRRFGFVTPVLIDDNDQIIAGHGRVAAAKLLDIAGVPVLRVSHLSEVEKRAYILADNKLAELAGWDNEILAIELQGLIDVSFDVDVTGFSTADVDFVLDQAAEAGRQPAGPEDRVPDTPGAVVSRLGDLWVSIGVQN